MSIPDLNASTTKTPVSGEPVLSLMGPVVTSIASPDQTDRQFAAWTGVIAPGISVPLHAHPDAEMAFVIDGRLEVLDYRDGTPSWLTLQRGESAVISPGARHALRNATNEPCHLILVSTASIADFFREIGRPVGSDSAPPQPDPAWIEAFAREAARRGYWHGSPAENEAIGLKL